MRYREVVGAAIALSLLLPGCTGAESESTDADGVSAEAAIAAEPSTSVAPSTTTAVVTSTSMSDADAGYCASLDTEMPDAVKDEFFDELGEPWSDRPSDLVITYVDAVGVDGQWVFVAEFDQVYEPGVFAIGFPVLAPAYALLREGSAPSRDAILGSIGRDFSEPYFTRMAACLDLNQLVE